MKPVFLARGSAYREKGLFSDRVASKIFLPGLPVVPPCTAFRLSSFDLDHLLKVRFTPGV